MASWPDVSSHFMHSRISLKNTFEVSNKMILPQKVQSFRLQMRFLKGNSTFLHGYCDLVYAYSDLANAYCDLDHAYCDLAYAYFDLDYAYFPHK